MERYLNENATHRQTGAEPLPSLEAFERALSSLLHVDVWTQSLPQALI